MTLSSYLPLEPTFITPGVLPLWLDVGAVALGAVFGATLANSRQAPLLGSSEKVSSFRNRIAT